MRARHAVVVAASAIQTPLFLQANGIGRAAALVGRGLQAHPGTAVVGVFDRPVELWFGATQGYESMHFWDERMKLETVGMPLELAAARLPELGAGADARAGRRSATWPSGASRCARGPRGGCAAGRSAAPPSTTT